MDPVYSPATATSGVPRNPLDVLPGLIQSYKRARLSVLDQITPENLSLWIKDFRRGFLRPLAQAMDAIEETDDLLVSVVPKCKAAVCRHGWDVITVESKDEAQEAMAQQQADVLRKFYERLQVTDALDQDVSGGTSLLLRQMMDAKGKRYAVHHLVWKPQPDGGYSAEMIFVPLNFFENLNGKLRFVQEPFGYYGVDMDPGAWLVTRGFGVMMACCICWLYKHLPLRDWLVYCERYGLPMIDGATDAQPGTEEWGNLIDAVTSAAAGDMAWVRRRGETEINFIEPKSGAGELPQPALIERMDRRMAAIWRGADLSTMSAGQGQGQGASLQGGEAELIEQDDAAWLSETCNIKLDRLVLDYAFGPGTPALAKFVVLTAPKEDTDADIRVDKFLLSAGFPITKQQASERYNRPLPEDTDGSELLTLTTGAPDAEPDGGDTGDGKGGDGAAGDDGEPMAQNERLLVAVNASLASTLNVPAGWLAPVQDLVDDLVAKAEDKNVSDGELLDFVRRAAARAPELFGKLDKETMAKSLEAAMGAAMVEGARAELRRTLKSRPRH